MRRLLLVTICSLSIICFTATARADETASEASANGQSSFNFITFRCKPDHDGGPESTPQSPPLDVDDPGTPGCNTWEINVVADGDLSHAQNSWELPLFDINYGVGDNLQLKYEIPYVSLSGVDAPSSAVGESKAGIKYKFYQNEETDTELAVYPQLSFSSSDSKAQAMGISSPGKILTLPLLYSHKLGQNAFGDVNITANLRMNFSWKEDVANFVSMAFGLGIPIRSKIALMGEVLTEQALKSVDGTRNDLIRTNLGFIATLSKNLMLFGSVGKSLHSSDLYGHNYVLTGLRFLD